MTKKTILILPTSLPTTLLYLSSFSLGEQILAKLTVIDVELVIVVRTSIIETSGRRLKKLGDDLKVIKRPELNHFEIAMRKRVGNSVCESEGG